MTARQHAKRILTHCRLQPENMGDHLVMGIQVAMNEAVADAQDMLAEAERQVGIMREALEYAACLDMDDADFHQKDRFDLAETFIAVSNRARTALAATDATTEPEEPCASL